MAAVLLSLAACEVIPPGPGTVDGTVTGDPALGAVVLDVVWRGVQDVEGASATLAYWSAVPGERDRYRMVLVEPRGGDLSFQLSVDDLYLEGPVVTVVAAADTLNRPMAVGSLRVRLER